MLILDKLLSEVMAYVYNVSYNLAKISSVASFLNPENKSVNILAFMNEKLSR
jgi:hypothetical protein